MATCPDRMVNLISKGSGSSSGSSRNESCELVPKDEESGGCGTEMDSLQINKPIIINSKKLSVVPEQDEQLTVQSTSSPPRPSILQNKFIVEDELDYPVVPPTTSSGHRMYSRFSESHIDQLEGGSLDEEIYEPQPIILEPVVLPEKIPVSTGGPVAVNQPYSKVGDRVFKCYSVAFVNQTQIS